MVSEMGGIIPDTPEQLMKSLPGVGRYTAGGWVWSGRDRWSNEFCLFLAGAIASIAFKKVRSPPF